ncbi:MAG: galactokinase [Bacteroidetes bacterium]|nr:galactokinase [Bacteroidota bacterium]MDA0874090.1 galactokinase [Bacteroidota bacterium]
MNTTPAADARSLFASAFDATSPVWAYAPGRIEVIGNHTDYNGGTVVGAAIDRGIAVAAALREDGRIRLLSREASSAILETAADTYQEAVLPSWTAYVLGVIDEFRMRGWMDAGAGCDLAIASTLPVGTGLSSSAALELATAGALAEALRDDGQTLGTALLIEAAHRAENRYVGMPCGLLDQTVVARGKEGHLVVLDAATSRHTVIPLPQGHGFALFRSHISHALVDSPYETRHRECREVLMALERMIPGIRHLARCHPADLDAYGVTLSDALARRASHVIHEQRRVGRFLRALAQQDAIDAGQCLLQSHESSKSLFENSTPELDMLVGLLKTQDGVRGARLSGGGWGGSVLALVDPMFSDTSAERVCDAYQELFEARPHWWRTRACDGMVHARS